ncbi:MAG: enoyl-CoA hydratase/isomerase family protein [Dethiosulfatibacter sp.]|nr:enoyl-CoA hydratase/isomerase family protein [Dethiosulfatibacter sp.]
MYQYKNIKFENHDGVGILTMNRPEALNALNSETLAELSECVDKIAADNDVQVVILTGEGKSFVAGADIKEMVNMTSKEGYSFGKTGQAVFSKIEKLPQPVIAAVNGFAFGGGCELSMACDIRLASEKAKFGQPEVALGIIPGFAGSQRLPRIVGKGIAKELLYTGNTIDAQEAYRIGLVNKVYSPETLIDEAKKMAAVIMSKGPYAVRLCKEAVNTGFEVDQATGSDFEASLFGITCSTEDKKEGMTAFIEKRKATFVGK